jgi:hypothetical protein
MSNRKIKQKPTLAQMQRYLARIKYRRTPRLTAARVAWYGVIQFGIFNPDLVIKLINTTTEQKKEMA